MKVQFTDYIYWFCVFTQRSNYPAIYFAATIHTC